MNENQENLTDNTVPDAAQLTAAEGGAADSNALSLAELNLFLGKDFKDKASALQALKDTQSYVGKKIAAANPAPVVDQALKAQVRSLEEEVFYANNPQYREQRELIKQFGGNPAEVVERPAFKTVFEKVKVADEVAQTKSVVSSNSRLGTTSSVTDDAVKMANATGSTERTSDVLAKGIIEELGLN